MIKAIGYAAKSSSSDLKPFEFERKNPKSNEIQVDIMFCGVCHSDIHQVKNEWKNTNYPCMPGHEIVGAVVKVGDDVKKFKVGDFAGIGCIVSSCGKCDACKSGQENYCEKGATGTYNGNMREPQKEENTFGGYSNTIVIREDFALRIPKNMDPAAAAPLMCAGVTTFSPLTKWNVGKGTQVGVVGLGGLGHMAVQLAVAMGAEVTVITTSPEKRQDAIKYGAKKLINSNESEEMKKNERSLDFILSTIPEEHDINPYIDLLKRDGTICVVGCLVPLEKPIDMSKMIMDRRSLASSVIGNIKETQDVLDFCAQREIQPFIKVIGVDEIKEAYEQIEANKADFRYVLDLSTLEGKKQSVLSKIGLT